MSKLSDLQIHSIFTLMRFWITLQSCSSFGVWEYSPDYHDYDIGVTCTFEAPGAECVDCEKGFFSDATDNDACKPCTAGSYNPSEGSTECQLCAEGTAISIDGATACAVCQSGLTTDDMTACACGLGQQLGVPTGELPPTTLVRLQTALGTPSFDSESTVSGRVEVFVDGAWGTVEGWHSLEYGDGAFSSAEASVACNQLGSELGYTLLGSSVVSFDETVDGTGVIYTMQQVIQLLFNVFSFMKY